MTPAGIEAATFRFVARHINHCATAVPRTMCTCVKYNNLRLICYDIHSTDENICKCAGVDLL